MPVLSENPRPSVDPSSGPSRSPVVALMPCRAAYPGPAFDPRSFLAAVLENSDEAIIGTTLDGIIISWNTAAEKLYGYAAAEVIGRHQGLLDGGNHAGPIPGIPPAQYATGCETVHFARNDAPIRLMLSRSPVRDSAGNLAGMATVARPIAQPRDGRFRLLFESNPLPMWVYDRETLQFLEVNDAAVTGYGYSRAEFFERRITDIHPQEDRPRLEQHLAQERSEERHSGPWRQLLKNKTIIDVEVASHLVDWNGRRAALVVAQDITERERIAESRCESEERFRTAFEHAPLGMCLTALDGRFLQVNDALSQMLGYTRQELLEGAWQNLTHLDDLECSREAVAHFRQPSVNTFQFEKRYIHKNGNVIWVRLRISVVKNASGAPMHFITHVEDITARRHAELALQESEEKYRSLIHHIPDVVWVADAAGRVAFVSPNGERLIGLTVDEVYQRGTCALFESIHPDDVTRVTGAFEMLFYGDRTYDVEFRVRSSSDWLWVHDRAVSTYERDGVRYASGLRSDVSERRRTEAALRARDAAEVANRTKSAFLANMSHELRTPLNAIIGYSQMLREDYMGPEQAEVTSDLQKIERSGQLLLGIINDVLDLSKIEAGRIEVKAQEMDVAAVLEDVYDAVEPLARQQGNTLSLDCPDDARLAYADIAKFRQSVLNLVNNACKFTQNGSISIAVRRLRTGEGDWTEVRVADTGIGIRPEHLGKLFQPFSQVDDSATRKYNGTGLGLAISRRFCQMMGGDITVESTPGQGSCFSLRVPVAREPAGISTCRP